VVRGADIEVVFDAPTKDWAARRNTPTIDVYLYDIREDLRRRQYGLIDMKNPAGHTNARRQPARFYKLSYLVTAWTQRPEDEHRLLSALLGCFLKHDYVPMDVLAGSLREEIVPFTLNIAIPPPEDRALSDVWSALGGELKPSLDLVIIAPFDLDRATPTAAPVQEEPRFTFERRAPGRRGGPGSGRAPAAASAGGAGRRGRSGGDGDGDAGGDADTDTGVAATGVPAAAAGDRILARESMQRRRIPGLPSPPLDPDYEPIVAEETLSVGKTGRPGRIFRIRTTSEPEQPEQPEEPEQPESDAGDDTEA
jgi:hypothetical protein